MPTTEHTTPYEVITNRMLALLEQGTVPWRQPWDSATGMPRNLFSQRAYKGINVWLLTAMGYASPFWATFHQVKAVGGSVRKGERGVPVVFFQWSALFAPAGTPEPVIAKLREVARAAAADHAFVTALATVETPVQYLDAPEMQRFWEADAKKLAEAVRRVGKVE